MGEDEAGMRLIEAGMIGDTAEMAAAVEAGAPVGYQDPGGQTALFWAAMEGHGEALDWLLEREAPVPRREGECAEAQSWSASCVRIGHSHIG